MALGDILIELFTIYSIMGKMYKILIEDIPILVQIMAKNVFIGLSNSITF
jgi:hypothetical protein